MKTKICTKCGNKKSITDYNKHNETADGYFNSCRECNRLERHKWRKTKDGVISTIYTAQKQSSKTRGHKQPKYTLKELKEWCLSKPLFHKLYGDWVNSDYNRWLKPSIDRLDNNKGYSFRNIQLTTWKQNHKNHKDDVKNGVDTRLSKAVLKYSLDGELLDRFHSLRNAARECKIDKRDLRRACKGQRKTVGGFVWEYE